MKRTNYTIKVDGAEVKTKFAWNSSLQFMYDYISDRSRRTHSEYTIQDQHFAGKDIKGHTAADFYWLESATGNVIKVTIERQK